jgi:hypothetical protein
MCPANRVMGASLDSFLSDGIKLLDLCYGIDEDDRWQWVVVDLLHIVRFTLLAEYISYSAVFFSRNKSANSTIVYHPNEQ